MNSQIVDVITGCVFYLSLLVTSHVARVMFRGRHDRLNWSICMDGMEKELVLSQVRRKRDVNYLRYYGRTA